MGPPVSPYLPPSNWLQTGYVRHILTVGSAPLVFWGNVVGARYNVRTSISLSKVGMRVEHLVFAPNRCKNQVLAPNTGFSWESRLPTRPKTRKYSIKKRNIPWKRHPQKVQFVESNAFDSQTSQAVFSWVPFFIGIWMDMVLQGMNGHIYP